MVAYRTTVIVKTDIVGFTPMVGSLTDSGLQTLLTQQTRLISGVAAENEGVIIKGEGDAFYIAFPSVTTAALAAMKMHERLRLQQVGRGEDANLAIRIVIAVGDLLHKDNDVFGKAMNLIARIESITPANEIYLSHAAWLLLNQSEVQSSFVGTFSFKGVSEPEKVFKIEQKHRTKIVTDQFIVFAEVRGWLIYVRSHPLTAVENVLIKLDDLANMISINFEGIVRNVAGDEYLFTFANTDSVLSAAEALYLEWESVARSEGIGLAISIHKGDFNILRSYIFGNVINEAGILLNLGKFFWPGKDSSYVIVSDEVRNSYHDTEHQHDLRPLALANIADDSLRSFAREHGPHQLVVGDVRPPATS